MIKLRGESIANASEMQTVSLSSSSIESAPIEIDRWFRDGLHPNASPLNQMNEAANQAVVYRTKELFGHLGGDGDFIIGAAHAGTTVRFRGAFRTGPYAIAAQVVVVLRQNAPAATTSRGYSTMDLYSDAAMTSLVSTTEFNFGVGDHAATDWVHRKVVTKYVELSADTDYYVKFSDVDYCLVLGVSIFELGSMLEGVNGYLAQNTSTHTPVLNLHRQNLVTVSNALWQKGGAKCFDWDPQTDALVFTTTSAAAVTICNGYVLDGTGKDRESQTSGVPCVFKACLKSSSGAQTATVYLKDSGGSTIASVSTTSTTPIWASTTFNLPASSATYKTMASCTGGATNTVYGITAYEYG
jgi:hypothetical protein